MLERLNFEGSRRSLVRWLRLLPTEDSISAGDVPLLSHIRMGILGWSFFIAVLVPTIACGVYFSFLQSSEYISEAHFTVRKGGESKSIISDVMSGVSASIGGIGGGLGSNSTTQDVFIVADYIRSRTMIEDLGGKQVLLNSYSSGKVDWLSRLSNKASLEKAWKYWNRKVSAAIDTPSGIVTLRVRGFKPDTARDLAKAILNKSEGLVNEISERSRLDTKMRALGEVQSAEERLRQARIALVEFRNKNSLIDPALSAKSISENIGKLLQERVALENNRASLGSSVSADSPTLRVLDARIAATDTQIANLRSELTSQSKSETLATQIAGFESRQIEVQFAEKLYTIAQDAYIAARQEQEKQQLYLVVVDQPSMPDEAAYPRKILDTATAFAALFILWSMGALLMASVHDHMGG